MPCRLVQSASFAALLALAGAVAADSPPVLGLAYSADMGANIVGAGTFAGRRQYVIDHLDGLRAATSIEGLPERADLRDFQLDADGAVLFSLDVGATLGGTYFRPADVVRLKAGAYSKAFDAEAAGVPLGVRCDGVARSGTNGSLLLSFDRTFAAFDNTFRPADVIAITQAGMFGVKVLDAAALDLPRTLNVDAVDSIGGTTHLLLSFDTGGKIGDTTFADEDILELTLATSELTVRFPLLASSDRWAAADLDGLATIGDGVFRDSFE